MLEISPVDTTPSEVCVPTPTPTRERATFKHLRAEVERYFAARGLKEQGSWRMYGKMLFIACAWAASYCGFLALGPKHVLLAVGGLAVLTFFSIALELNLMHDASHSALSQHRWLNVLGNLSLTFIGASSVLWRQKHVVRHHAYTNVPGEDLDIEGDGLFRFHEGQPYRFYHRWQHIYAWGLYSLTCLNWLWGNDTRQTLFNTYKLRGKQLAWMWVEFVVSKASHIVLFMVLPYLMFRSLTAVAAMYLVHWMVFGLFIATIFQLAHVMPPTSFPQVAKGKVGDWAEHQLSTTADFATRNRFLTWYIGGLNFQVEHHIFPRICHLHYPQLQQIVKQFCDERSVAYHEYPTLWSAICAHQQHLRTMGQAPAAA